MLEKVGLISLQNVSFCWDSLTNFSIVFNNIYKKDQKGLFQYYFMILVAICHKTRFMTTDCNEFKSDKSITKHFVAGKNGKFLFFPDDLSKVL
jgi:hypothetical protein